jgi:hypothetical protein
MALGPAVLGLGYLAGAGWATATWPFEISRLSEVFLASILAAMAAPVLWVAGTQEWGALRATALFPLIMLAAMAGYLIQEQAADDASGLLGFAGVMAVGALWALALVIAGARTPLHDRRRMPSVVRASFAVFVAVLVVAGLALVAGAENVMPWAVDEQSRVMFGFVFLGAASSYAYGVLRPECGYAYAPLLGFLAYDLVLLGPLVAHLSDVVDEQRASLVIYVAVVVYSVGLAAYFLLIRADTRLWQAPAS